MAKIFSVKPGTRFIVFLLILFGIGAIFLSTIPTLQSAAFIYGLLVIFSLFIYTNPVFSNDLAIIPKGGIFKGILLGAFLAVIILILPKIGLSIGIPLVPASVESNLRFIIIAFFAPVVEELSTRGALLGLIRYFERSGRNLSTFKLWIAIIIQAVLFMFLHFTAYSAGWYSAPDIGVATLQLSAVSASLIAALIFGLIMGFAVTKSKNIFASIVAHFAVNTFIFVNYYSIFVSILPLLTH